MGIRFFLWEGEGGACPIRPPPTPVGCAPDSGRAQYETASVEPDRIAGGKCVVLTVSSDVRRRSELINGFSPLRAAK